MENVELSLPRRQSLKLLDFLGHLPVGVAWASIPDGTIRYVNERFVTLFGYALEELSTVHEWIVQCYVDPEQAQAIDTFWYRQSGAQLEGREIEEIELDIRCKDGSVKTVLSSKILLPEQSGALSLFLDITPRSQREKLVRQQAMEDPLTGLLNRRAFSEYFEECLARSGKQASLMALLLLDLDQFKPINDTFGHEAGDRLLEVVAKRLRGCLRDEDLACRIGGDEFAVLVCDMQQESTAWLLADRIMQALARPINLGGNQVSINSSIGIAVYPQDGPDQQSLFRHADEAMYRVKRSKRDAGR